MRPCHVVALLLGLSLTFLAQPAPAHAEGRVVLKTGAVLTGKIVKETEEKVVIEIAGLGKVEVPRGQIVRVEGGASSGAQAPTPRPRVEVPERPRIAVPDRPTATSPERPRGPTPKHPTVAPAARPEPPAEPVAVEIPYEDIEPGVSALVVLKGRDHGTWKDSGRRYFAEIEVAGPKRMKLMFDREKGVLGYAWVPRAEVDRVIRLDDDAEHRFLFFEGIETGSWLTGATMSGVPFEGQLANVSMEGKVTLWVAQDSTVSEQVIELGDLKCLQATVRAAEITNLLRSLSPGEPVRVTIGGRPDPIEGRLAGADRAFFEIDTVEGPEAETRRVRVFKGLPITNVETLPEALRPALREVPRNAHVTVTTVATEDGERIRRAVTGQLVHATTESVWLETRSGTLVVAMDSVSQITVPATEDVLALTEGKAASDADMALAVVPGMTRKEAESVLPDEHPGIDVLFDEDRVSKVYCRSPFKGPVYGIEIGGSFIEASKKTDLFFDTQIDREAEVEPRISTMLSHTISGIVVKLYVTARGDVLAAELATR